MMQNPVTNRSESRSDILTGFDANYLLACLFLLIAIIGTVGNLLVIISVQIDEQMRRSLTNRLIVHVACCDLIILLFNIPDIIQFVSSTNGNWVLSNSACKFIRSVLVLAQYASVLTMCAVTIERFFGIVYPLRSKFLNKRKRIAQIMLFVWLFSLLCVSPNVVYLTVLSTSGSRRCCLLHYSGKNRLESQRKYVVHKSVESAIFYFIPLALQLYCYLRIATQLSRVDRTLQGSFRANKKSNVQLAQVVDQHVHCEGIEQHSSVLLFLQEDLGGCRHFLDNQNSAPSRGTATETCVSSFGNRLPSNDESRECNSALISSLSQAFAPVSSKSRAELVRRGQNVHGYCSPNVTYKALKSRRSVIKMLGVVVLIYFVSFSPQVLVFILFDTNAVRPVPKFIQTPYFIAFTMLLVTISSASNPIVYAIFCSKFRRSFSAILRRPYFCCRIIIN